MRVRKDYVEFPSRRTSSFYGVLHRDAKQADKEWDQIAPRFSLEDFSGTAMHKFRKNPYSDSRTENA